jgi:putative PIN family toxin of toxin-antitoxin system
VFDCNIFLQAAVRDTGPAFACIAAVEAGRASLFVSRAILAEIGEVLLRPKTRRKFPQLGPASVRAFLLRISAMAALVDSAPEIVRLPRDPKDEPYLNVALAVRAEYLVTRDKDLLDLMSGPTEFGPGALAQVPRLRILDPVAFLHALAAELPEQ